ncbi:MAG: insulinase family protein [Gemmatimonadaceae bacterium]|nr:insulinase family protein [Gemmatimonadaceae bacterium]
MATTASSPRAARARDILPFDITETTLANGLRVIIVPTGFPDLVSLQIPVQTGSRNEIEPGKTGFAHFFEHMMFRGTEAYPPEVYQRILTRAGARQNAYTTDDYTNYHITFSRDDLERILEIEADRFQRLSYPEEDFKTEARAVLGEYNKNSADPVEKLFEVMRDSAYTTHTYKHTTMGFLRDIEDMPNQFDYSRTFFRRWYRPEYTTLILAGDVTAESALPLIERYWGSWERGDYVAEIPAEPAPTAPVYAHVPWETPTLPWVAVSFHGPAFSASGTEYVAADLLFDLWFGTTSDLYRRLVEEEQKVDLLSAFNGAHVDPGLFTVIARVKDPRDVVAVRDAILRTAGEARATLLPAKRVADAKAYTRYTFVRRLDNTEDIAATLARYAHYERSSRTIESLFATYARVTARDLREAARRMLTDERLVVTTLAHGALPAEVSRGLTVPAPRAPSRARAAFDILVQRSPLSQLDVKLLFTVGSAHDPVGKEGLAALSAAMIARAGSRERRFDEITRAFFPMAASFSDQVDKEMTTFTARVHRDTWKAFADIALPMLLDPGFREEDFARLRDAQRNALTQDLRSSNEEELGKERLQEVVFAGTRYAHPVLGTVAGLEAITLDDVRRFVAEHYSRANLMVGAAGDVPDALLARLRTELAALPAGTATPRPTVSVARKPGIRVHFIEKETRATAISLGHPIEVTRAHPDFAALWVARAWLGEHRSSVSHLYQRIREIRGMNYGDYAYIEAFPGAMFAFVPDANRARTQQLFEIWIRPVLPANAHMALRIAIHELRALIERGMSEEAFESTRDYVLKSLPLLTATQDHQLGYALDARWHGTPGFTTAMRERVGRLTREEVNAAIRRHLSGHDVDVVIITKDVATLREALLADAFSPVTYDAPKPDELLAEDRVIGALRLGITAANVTVARVDDVFAR